jgi:hypothetical protein
MAPPGTDAPVAMPAGVMPPGGLSGGPVPMGPVASPQLRASDADRAEAVDALREEFALGRLSHQTFMYRMNTAMEARHVSELPPLFEDLPAPPARPGLLGRLKGPFRRLTGRPAGAGPGSPAPADAAHASPARRLTSVIRLPAAPLRPSTAPPPPLPFPRTIEGFYTIGRDGRCDLAIEDMTVSRIHARLERTPAGWVLKDLSSTNGTRVNGWRVRGQVSVRPGDVVRFGDVEYILTDDAGYDEHGTQTRISSR